MDECTETFATLIKFMTSMKWSSVWRRFGMAWDEVSPTQWMSGTNVSGGGVFMSIDGILSIWYDPTAQYVYKHIYVIELNTSTKLLLLIFCISRDTFKVR